MAMAMIMGMGSPYVSGESPILWDEAIFMALAMNMGMGGWPVYLLR